MFVEKIIMQKNESRFAVRLRLFVYMIVGSSEALSSRRSGRYNKVSSSRPAKFLLNEVIEKILLAETFMILYGIEQVVLRLRKRVSTSGCGTGFE